MSQYYLALLFFMLFGKMFAQDTMRYMQYNLLDYSVPFVNCSDVNNSMLKKNAMLRTIMAEVNPDVVAVNEIGANATSVKLFLDSVMNKYSTRKYQKASMTNNAGAQTVNMIYYDPLLVKLKSQDIITDDLRDINIYTFYLNTSDLINSHDTCYFSAVVAHFKAGNTASDREKRSTTAANIIDYLNIAYTPGNFILSGDLNVYQSDEQAWQIITNQAVPGHHFIDPINMIGNWSGNISFSNTHTQSTHADNNGCHASGGMNDRFDFVLVSGDLFAGTMGIKSITESYKSPGQDGLHLNVAINASPQNNSVPINVLEALYGASDHLPVILDFETQKKLAVNELENTPGIVILENPSTDMLKFKLKGMLGSYTIEILSMCGQSLIMEHKTISQGVSIVEMPLQSIKTGMYLLRIRDSKGNSISKKFILAGN